MTFSNNKFLCTLIDHSFLSVSCIHDLSIYRNNQRINHSFVKPPYRMAETSRRQFLTQLRNLSEDACNNNNVSSIQEALAMITQRDDLNGVRNHADRWLKRAIQK